MTSKQKMIAMEYQADICKPIILNDGTVDGFDYMIVSFGTHPTAYVNIPSNHPYFEKSTNDIDIDCHGGLTYSADNPIIQSKIGWWIGWDYAHSGDYLGYFELFRNHETVNGKKWTTSEIKEDVQNVISQLKAKY